MLMKRYQLKKVFTKSESADDAINRFKKNIIKRFEIEW